MNYIIKHISLETSNFSVTPQYSNDRSNSIVKAYTILSQTNVYNCSVKERRGRRWVSGLEKLWVAILNLGAIAKIYFKEIQLTGNIQK